MGIRLSRRKQRCSASVKVVAMKKLQVWAFALVFGFGASSAPFSVPAAQAQAARSDADIQSDVSRALANSPQLQGQNITVATIDGDVTISGTVRDQASRSEEHTSELQS